MAKQSFQRWEVKQYKEKGYEIATKIKKTTKYIGKMWCAPGDNFIIIIIIIDNRGLNARWCLTPLLLSLPIAGYLGQRGLIPAGLPHTTAQCHLIILGEAVLFCLNHSSFRTPVVHSADMAEEAQLSQYICKLSAVEFLPIESFCTILHYFITLACLDLLTYSWLFVSGGPGGPS